ncbi:MAG: proton-conducting transporter membrane subunit [Thermoanaerobaculales bacterium]|jgi:multicomponent Na+:H+ antiporter subunit D|nr:proton-conducting transporter membrane subunit [Thermoanaerobaculales bacterium]
MTSSTFVLLGILLSSFITGSVIFFLREDQHRLRTGLNLAGAVLKILFVVVLLRGVLAGQTFDLSFTMAPGVVVALGADANSVLFVSLSSVLWFFTTLYAVGYLEDSPRRSRFFGFFSLCVTSTVGIALAANLVTFLIFYELLTISTFPLVVHRGTRKALAAGRVYLAYTVGGGTLLLFAVAWLQSISGPITFTERGALGESVASHPTQLTLIFFVFIAALGVKSALVPLHGWLPRAMVAPAPVSALLHAVAVVKAGAFGIVRLVYDVYGIETAEQLGVLRPLAVLAGFTIVYGSVRALFQDDLKKRLAFSTVSQVSYITLGTAIFGPVATLGGIVHLVHQGIMKITLFFAAGNYAETLGIHRVSEMNGVGRRMPWTTAAFTVGALGMIGIPPLAGFVSKLYLKQGAIAAGQSWVVLVLAASSLLNAAYFLPILYRSWFLPAPEAWPNARDFGRFETHWMLLLPPLFTAAAVVLAGVFADSNLSPLAWARIIAGREYGP